MRTLRTLVVLLSMTVGVGLTAPPSAASAPPKAKAFTVTAAPATSAWSQAVKLTASITPKGGGVPRGGTVTFLVDGAPIGTAPATARLTSVTTTTLPPGEHAVTATYGGDDRTAPGTSTTSATVTVVPAPTTVTLTPTQTRVLPGRLAEVKALVQAVAPAAPSRRPTGFVSFRSSCRSGRVAVNANGVATWRAALCPGGPGNRTIRATYTGSANHAGAPEVSTTVRMVFPTQDQQTTGDPGPDVPVESRDGVVSAYAQTFTAGRTGQLSDVSFGVSWESDDGVAPDPLGVSIRAVDQSGRPVGAPLGTATFGTEVIPEGSAFFRTLAFTVPAPITAGTRYALLVEAAHDGPGPHGRWLLWTTQGDTYPDPLHRRDVTGTWTPQTHDLLFTTFVHTPT